VVDAPGRLDLDVLVGCEQIGQLALPVGEQARAGVEDPPCGVEGVVFAAAVSEGVLLHPSAVWSSASPANRTTWEGSITATAFGSSSVAAVLNPVKPVHHDDLRAPARHIASCSASQVLHACLERSSTMSSSRAGALADTGQVDDHGDVVVAAAGVPPHVLADPMTSTPSNRPGWLIKTRLPSASTALLAVFQDAARPSATRATVRC
jgi:hypothetical protein